jgi:hypothetical protein
MRLINYLGCIAAAAGHVQQVYYHEEHEKHQGEDRRQSNGLILTLLVPLRALRALRGLSLLYPVAFMAIIYQEDGWV